jgi:hypothetical protein
MKFTQALNFSFSPASPLYNFGATIFDGNYEKDNIFRTIEACGSGSELDTKND